MGDLDFWDGERELAFSAPLEKLDFFTLKLSIPTSSDVSKGI